MLNILFNKEFIKILLGIISGLGIFLYGINLLSESLNTLAKDKMKAVLKKMTNNIFCGVLTGFLVTVILQSSSGTTVLSISLISIGLMSMRQAIGVIMGANIGTTVTPFLFSFPKTSDFSLLLIGLGAFLIFFNKKKKIITLGQAVFGFGLLFFGINLMSNNLVEIIYKPEYGVDKLFANLSMKPWIALFTGAGITALVQSSSATTVIIQRIYETKTLSLLGALPILFGNNIGTSITAILASIGGSKDAKRASVFHILFNIIGALIFMICLFPFYHLINFLVALTNASARITIAYSHLIFNIVNTLLLVWFVDQIVWFIKKIIPD